MSADTQRYFLPDWAQYSLLFGIVVLIGAQQLVTRPSIYTYVTAGGAIAILGLLAGYSIMLGEDPLESGTIRQMIGGYVIITGVYVTLMITVG